MITRANVHAFLLLTYLLFKPRSINTTVIFTTVILDTYHMFCCCMSFVHSYMNSSCSYLGGRKLLRA